MSIKCKCGHINETGSTFCEECGAKLNRVCPNCGNSVKESAKFCNKCGTKLDNIEMTDMVADDGVVIEDESMSDAIAALLSEDEDDIFATDKNEVDFEAAPNKKDNNKLNKSVKEKTKIKTSKEFEVDLPDYVIRMDQGIQRRSYDPDKSTYMAYNKKGEGIITFHPLKNRDKIYIMSEEDPSKKKEIMKVPECAKNKSRVFLGLNSFGAWYAEYTNRTKKDEEYAAYSNIKVYDKKTSKLIVNYKLPSGYRYLLEESYVYKNYIVTPAIGSYNSGCIILFELWSDGGTYKSLYSDKKVRISHIGVGEVKNAGDVVTYKINRDGSSEYRYYCINSDWGTSLPLDNVLFSMPEDGLAFTYNNNVFESYDLNTIISNIENGRLWSYGVKHRQVYIDKNAMNNSSDLIFNGKYGFSIDNIGRYLDRFNPDGTHDAVRNGHGDMNSGFIVSKKYIYTNHEAMGAYQIDIDADIVNGHISKENVHNVFDCDGTYPGFEM